MAKRYVILVINKKENGHIKSVNCLNLKDSCLNAKRVKEIFQKDFPESLVKVHSY